MLEAKFPPTVLLNVEPDELTDPVVATKTASKMVSSEPVESPSALGDFVNEMIGKAGLQIAAELKATKEEQHKPEQWLDIEREKRYASLSTELEKMSAEVRLQWLELVLDITLTDDEKKDITVKVVDSDDGKRIANHPIKRPVVECTNVNIVQAVMTCLMPAHLFQK